MAPHARSRRRAYFLPACLPACLTLPFLFVSCLVFLFCFKTMLSKQQVCSALCYLFDCGFSVGARGCGG
jgi:hypothetical protein